MNRDKTDAFKKYLIENEKSKATIEKYIRDVRRFFEWKRGRRTPGLEKQMLLEFKQFLQQSYITSSVNSIISSINAYIDFIGRPDLKIQCIKTQRLLFAQEEKTLTKAEYKRLVAAAKKLNNERLMLVIETICATGIRVSELRYITIESAKQGRAVVDCKGKQRVIFIPGGLSRKLTRYTGKTGRSSGMVFVTKSGNALDRSNIWSDMKKLCATANVDAEKVFPNNLRHLFARTYYNLHKDIVRLADILGHSNVETTRIYTTTPGWEHKKYIEEMCLII